MWHEFSGKTNRKAPKTKTPPCCCHVEINPKLVASQLRHCTKYDIQTYDETFQLKSPSVILERKGNVGRL